MDLSLFGQSRDAEGRHRAAHPGLGPWVGARVASPRGPILRPSPSSLLRSMANGQFTAETPRLVPPERFGVAPRPLPVSSSARPRSPPHGRPVCPQVDNSVSASGQFGVSASLLLPLHQVGKLDSWEDFQDRQAMTLFTTRLTAGTTEPMSSAPTANGICSLVISPAPRHGTLSRSSATA